LKSSCARGRRLIDHRLLQFQPALISRDRCFRGGDRGLGLCHLGGEVAIVDDEEDGTFGDFLIVGDPHLLEVALDLRADHRDVALNIGVVGRLLKAQCRPPVPAAGRAEGEHHYRQDHQDNLAHQVAPVLPRLN
jgi:hypothetical protein